MHTQKAKYQFCLSLIAYILSKTHYLVLSVNRKYEKLICDSIHVTKNNFALLFCPNTEKKIQMMRNSGKLRELYFFWIEEYITVIEHWFI